MNTPDPQFADAIKNHIQQKQPVPDAEIGRISTLLFGMVRDGLAEAGIPTKRPKYGLIYVDTLTWPIGVAIRPYTYQVPVWRITFGGRPDGYMPPLVDPKELTLHVNEFCTQTGVDLARLLREPQWRWPLFDHDPHYPRYAWSHFAHHAYETWRLAMEAREKKILSKPIAQ